MNQAIEAMRALPVLKAPRVGKALLPRLEEMGVTTVGDLVTVLHEDEGKVRALPRVSDALVEQVWAFAVKEAQVDSVDELRALLFSTSEESTEESVEAIPEAAAAITAGVDALLAAPESEGTETEEVEESPAPFVPTEDEIDVEEPETNESEGVVEAQIKLLAKEMRTANTRSGTALLLAILAILLFLVQLMVTMPSN
jgi:hypothetical protein